MAIARLGDDIVVTCQHERLFQFQQCCGAGCKALHPAQLVGILLSADRVAIGQVDAPDAHHASAKRHHAFKIAGLFVGRIAGQAGPDVLQPGLRQYGHAVEGLLAVGHHLVARGLDLQPGEAVILCLDLLKAEHIGLGFLQEGQQMFEPLADRVDVPGGDSHGVVLMSGFCQRVSAANYS